MISILSGIKPFRNKEVKTIKKTGTTKIVTLELSRNDHEKMSDYAYISEKPFSAGDVIAETGMKKSSVYLWLDKMVNSGELCKVEIPGRITFYTRETRKAAPEQKTTKSKDLEDFGVMARIAIYSAFGLTLVLAAQCTGAIV
jgi:hypothetical protein